MRRIITLLIFIITSSILFGQTNFSDEYINEIIIKKTYITISYNPLYKIPNYVGEILTTKIIYGNIKREAEFYTEIELPVSVRTTTYQYSHTGYDRGHLAPAANYYGSKKGMHESFSMANVAPQSPDLNRGKWKEIELIVRYKTNIVDTLYVITGTIINKKHKSISTNIAVPNKFYKGYIGKKKGKIIISGAYIYNNDEPFDGKEITIKQLEKILNKKLFIGFK